MGRPRLTTPCTVCGKPPYAKSLCQVHYKQSHYFAEAELRRSQAKARRDANLDHYREYDRKRYAKDPTKRKGTGLKCRFGITLEQFQTILNEQSGVCKICRKPDPCNRALAVDHCHTTGRIRGLLCTRCNHGIGNFKDSVELLENAIQYLKASTK